MSITSDVRSYAEIALEQGKQAVDQAGEAATEVADKIQDRTQNLASKASAKYVELTELGESLYGRVIALPAVDTFTTTVEPYVAQLNGYRVALTDKVEELYGELKKNDQLAKVLGTAELAAGVVIDTVTERVVKPVRSLVAQAPAPKASAPKPATARAAAAHKPAAKPTTTKATAAKASTTKRPATKRPASKA